MNRNMTEIGSAALPPERQRETAHRYMLGLYRMMERLTGEFPHVLFEGCASGGGSTPTSRPRLQRRCHRRCRRRGDAAPPGLIFIGSRTP